METKKTRSEEISEICLSWTSFLRLLRYVFLIYYCFPFLYLCLVAGKNARVCWNLAWKFVNGDLFTNLPFLFIYLFFMIKTEALCVDRSTHVCQICVCVCIWLSVKFIYLYIYYYLIMIKIEALGVCRLTHVIKFECVKFTFFVIINIETSGAYRLTMVPKLSVCSECWI